MLQINLKYLIANKELEDRYNLTFRDLAIATGIPAYTISMMARNEITYVRLEHLALLCYFFECELSDLIQLDPTREKMEAERKCTKLAEGPKHYSRGNSRKKSSWYSDEIDRFRKQGGVA